MVLKLKEVLHLLEKNKSFAIDPENKVILTERQLGEMISTDFVVAEKYIKNGTFDRVFSVLECEASAKYFELKSRYSEPRVLLFHLQYALAPRLPFSYCDEIYKTIEVLGKSMYKGSVHREVIVDAMKNKLFSAYIATKNFGEQYMHLIEGVRFAEEYVTVDENIAFDLLSSHLCGRDWYKYDGIKFTSIDRLYAHLVNSHLLKKFSKTMESDSKFFAWLFFHGKFNDVLRWKKTINEVENYIDTKKGEY